MALGLDARERSAPARDADVGGAARSRHGFPEGVRAVAPMRAVARVPRGRPRVRSGGRARQLLQRLSDRSADVHVAAPRSWLCRNDKWQRRPHEGVGAGPQRVLPRGRARLRDLCALRRKGRRDGRDAARPVRRLLRGTVGGCQRCERDILGDLQQRHARVQGRLRLRRDVAAPAGRV